MSEQASNAGVAPAPANDGPIVWKGSFKRWMAAFGPTAVLASIAMGPGTIASAMGSGSKLGYGIGWLIALAAVWAVVSLYLVGKTSAVTGLSVIEQYHRFYHKAIAVFIGVILIVIIIPVEAFTGVVIGHSLSFMFPSLSPIWWTAICFAVVVVLYFFTGGFRWVVLLCTVLVAFMTLTFFVNAIVVGPDVGKLARGLVVPWLPEGREGTLLFVGILGGSAGIIGMLFYGYTVRNAGWTKQDVPVMAWDNTVFTGVLFFLFSIGIYISGVALLGKPVGRAIEAAASLEPVAGPFARWLFAVGYFAATFTSGAAGALLVGYVLHDFIKWKVDGDIHKDKWFRLISVVVVASWFLGPLAANYMPPIMLLVFAMGLFNLCTPPVVALSLFLGRRRDVMGENRVGWFVTIMVALLFFFSLGAAYVFVLRVMAQAG